MANWTKSIPTGVSTRRRWNLEDRASLSKLKHHIAEEGCPEGQYNLARELLENDRESQCNVTDRKQQAVRWLICAAQQGHEDAAKLLQICHESGNGITVENADEVRYCLAMTPGERAARKAARELFSCLSQGNEHITPKQLERKMRSIYNLQRKKRRHDRQSSTSSSTTDIDTENENDEYENVAALGNGDVQQRYDGGQRQVITEANLVSAASNYAAGRLPVVNDALTLSVPHPQALDHVPCFHRIFFHPVLFFTLLYHRLINGFCALPRSLPNSARFGLLLLMYLLWTSDRGSNMLPLLSYYFSLATMLWSTCKMLKSKQEFIDFRIWSGLFLSYGDHNVEADGSEQRFLRNNMKPYLYFFIAFICNLIIYPLVTNEWLPHSELTIITGAFVFISMWAFMYNSSHCLPDWIVVISFAVNVLAKYPYEMDEVVLNRWRFLDLRVPTFPSFVIGNGIEFCLNCRTVLYLVIPLLLVQLAKRSNWHGVYTYLIPHCVTLSWLQICIAASQSATVFGVMRATLALAGIVLFLPLFGIVSLLIPVFVTIEWMGFTNTNLRWGSTAIIFGLAVLFSCILAVNRSTQKYVTMIQVLIGVIAVSVLIFPYMTSSFKDSSRTYGIVARAADSNNSNSHKIEIASLSWERYYALCMQPISQDPNKLRAQLRCSHLNGLAVSWQGTIDQIQIVHVSNLREEYISKYLPRWLGNIIRCIYGDPIATQLSCDAYNDETCKDWLNVLESIQDQNGFCSLQRWNRYEYELHVKIPTSGLLGKISDVVLRASHEFKNFTESLIQGDRVQFYGRLENARRLNKNERRDYILGTNAPPQVNLKSIRCLYCDNPHMKAVVIESGVKSSVDARMKDLMRGIKYLLNALLNPLIIFK